jgi:hypothetical protein
MLSCQQVGTSTMSDSTKGTLRSRQIQSERLWPADYTMTVSLEEVRNQEMWGS